ncbi:RNA polymerase factor sigma-32 [Ponticaulis profundi]|uniref:RNA polymerase factor sigma-32 n=1 Tax=Ponticaulis profundi TaxID=2665222 RepID=A0ABW1SCQ5_9PROT
MVSGSVETAVAEKQFLKRAMSSPLLESDIEKNLALRWRDEQDEKALHDLTSAYIRLVVSMASKFRNYGLPMSDLIQEGNVGLMLAASRFDPEREVRFSTYACWWIRSSIQDYVLRNWSIVRTGTTAAQKSLFFNLRRLKALINDTSEAAISQESLDFIATELNVSKRDVEHMSARMSASDRSLNAPMTQDGDSGEWMDTLRDESDTPEDLYMNEHDRQKRHAWISEALSCLNPREIMIIEKRRLSENTITLERLGQQLGLSKERVRQIEQAAMLKLKKALVGIVGDPEKSGLVPSI